MRILVGITGASGAVYGVALVRALHSLSVQAAVIASEMGERVLEYECGVTLSELSQWAEIADNRNLFSSLASGSHSFDGMVIAPCSMHTLGAVASGLSDTLLLRAAMVALKERRPMIAVVRETPYSLIHVENMAALLRAGGIVMPASPGFYTRPTEIWQLVQGMTGRILDQLHIAHSLAPRWEEPQRAGELDV